MEKIRKMENIKGVSVDMPLFITVQDLMYYDGPLSTHVKINDEDYLFDWVDCDEKYNRWLISKSDINRINKYLKDDIFYDLTFPRIEDFVIMVDITYNNGEVEYHNVMKVMNEDVPEDYKPSK